MNRETVKQNALTYCKLRYAQYSMYESYAKKFGTSYKSLYVLRQIYANPDGITQIEICQDSSCITKQTVSAVIKRFIEKNYVYVEEMSSDRRNKLVKLTDDGLAYAEKILQPVIDAEQISMECFDENEQKLFIKMCTEYAENLKSAIG